MLFYSRTYVLGAQQVGLLNVNGYYNSLLSFIDKAVEEEFISPTARHIVVLAPTPKELLDKLEVTHDSSADKTVRKLCECDEWHWKLMSGFLDPQEYSPRHEKVVPKTRWETEQLSYCKSCEAPPGLKLKEGKPIVQPQRARNHALN